MSWTAVDRMSCIEGCIAAARMSCIEDWTAAARLHRIASACMFQIVDYYMVVDCHMEADCHMAADRNTSPAVCRRDIVKTLIAPWIFYK